jgi:antitoxin MazE
MKVSRRGNNLAVRLPAAVVEALNLKAGDEIDIRVTGEKEFVVERKATREELIARIRTMGMALPPDYKFNREELNSRGMTIQYNPS